MDKDLELLTKKYFGLYFDKYRNRWCSTDNHTVNYLQTDFDLVCCSLVHKSIIAAIYHNDKANIEKGLVSELITLIDTGLFVNLRLLLKKERSSSNDPGTGTGGDFINDLSKAIRNKKEDSKIRQLESDIDNFTSYMSDGWVKNLESILLHKDSQPQKRKVVGKGSIRYNGMLVPSIKYAQNTIDINDVFERIEKFTNIISQYLNYVNIPKNIVFLHGQDLRIRVKRTFKIYNHEVNNDIIEFIVDDYKKKIPNTLKLIGWY